jgi:hypothetical protein
MGLCGCDGAPSGRTADAGNSAPDLGTDDLGQAPILDAGVGGFDAMSSGDGSPVADPLDGGPRAGDAAWRNAIATLVVLPDTQFYSATFPSVFAAQTQWIADQAGGRNIKAVLHVGDVVDAYDSGTQWKSASVALRQLDGHVPYLLVTGNHDEDGDLNLRKSSINDYFAPATMPWIVGSYQTGRIESSYMLVDLGARKYLIMGLEWGPRDSVLAWADAILKSYAAFPAIVVTHAFLDGNARYDWAKYPTNGPDQYWNPYWYSEQYAKDHDVPVANVNDGEEIYQKLILPNPNVRMVFCGHVLGDPSFGAVGRLSDVRPDGTHIHQMLSDYQVILDSKTGRESGLGYLRILELDSAKHEIRVRTYSPYLDRDLTLGDNNFTLPLDDF